MMQSMSQDEAEAKKSRPTSAEASKLNKRPASAARSKSEPVVQSQEDPVQVVLQSALDSWNQTMALFSPTYQRVGQLDTDAPLLDKKDKPSQASRAKSLPPMAGALAGSVQGWKAVAKKMDDDMKGMEDVGAAISDGLIDPASVCSPHLQEEAMDEAIVFYDGEDQTD